MSTRFFIRNDDVWTLDSRFRFFFDLAQDHGIPVVHAVIPGKMEKECIRFLCRAKDKNPHLLDIVQHGWMHTNYATNTKKYEFGPLRSLKAQRQDIQQGFKKMRLAFGQHFTPAFVPPYHGYDERTLTILEKEGFQIFSAAGGARGKKHLMNIPTHVSFSCYDNKEKSIHEARFVLSCLAKNIHRRSLSGVLTHHADFNSVVAKKELRRFFDGVRRLMDTEGWKAMLFSEILNRLY